MRLVRGKDRYEFLCQYEERAVPKEAGFRWDPIARVWYTENVTAAYRLSNYGSTEVKELIGRESAAVTALSSAKEADIEVPVPEGLSYYRFQLAGIKFARDRRRTLLADAPGLGKTIVGAGIINLTLPGSVLVICPASLKINWSKELAKWLVVDYSIEIIEGTTPSTGTDITIVNYDILGDRVEGRALIYKHPELVRPYDLIIIDESHYVKSSGTLRTKAVAGIVKAQRPSTRIVAMSGTPIVNRPVELFPVLKMLGSDLARNYMEYTRRYCGAYRSEYGYVVTGASNLGELQHILRSTVMIRRLKEDVLTELPEKRKQLMSIPGTDSGEEEWWDRYTSRRAELLAEVEVARTISKEAYHTAITSLRYELKVLLQDMSKIRHDSAVRKVPEAIKYIKEVMESVDKLVVFAHHHDVVDLLMEGLEEYGVVKLDGTMGTEERDKSVEEFQTNPKVRVFVGSIRAAGVGLTLTAASNVIFVEFDWSPGVMDQAADRTHRITQKYAVLVQYLVVDGTIDSKLAKINMEKEAVIDAALDNVGEVPAVPDSIEIEAAVSTSTITEELRDTVHRALVLMSDMCDGAQSPDDVGFSRFDSYIGKSLSSFRILSDKQVELGIKILRKYRGQLPADLYDLIYKE